MKKFNPNKQLTFTAGEISDLADKFKDSSFAIYRITQHLESDLIDKHDEGHKSFDEGLIQSLLTAIKTMAKELERETYYAFDERLRGCYE